MPAATRPIPQSGPSAPGQAQVTPSSEQPSQRRDAPKPAEVGGPKGPEPTRYGDWERNGRCSDF